MSTVSSNLFAFMNIPGGLASPDTIDNKTLPQDVGAAKTALSTQDTRGIAIFSDDALFQHLKTPNQYKAEGIEITADNWRRLARQESSRLYALGFTQASRPDISERIFLKFRTAQENVTPQDVRDWNNFDSVQQAAQRAQEMNSLSYVVSSSANELGRVTRETGRTVSTVAENVTNPLALGSLAVIGVVIGGIFLVNKVT